jgi:hypothetical protein
VSTDVGNDKAASFFVPAWRSRTAAGNVRVELFTYGGVLMRLWLMCFVLMCAPLAAQGLEVGDEAADLHARRWINPPTYTSLEELRGDVVLIKAWGIS